MSITRRLVKVLAVTLFARNTVSATIPCFDSTMQPSYCEKRNTRKSPYIPLRIFHWHGIHVRVPSMVLSIPDGGATAAAVSKQHQNPTTRASHRHTQQLQGILAIKTLVAGTAGVTLLFVIWYFRDLWIPLFNKEKLQKSTVATLRKLNDLPKFSSYTSYILGMALWESVGLSTIPVETAAGMVFGWPDGFYLNAMGKLLGACFAFALGRNSLLKDTIQQQFANNSFLQSIQSTTQDHPCRVAFLIKFGPLPETIKNFGSAILKPIEWWMFVLATMIHGWTFSALWTYLGVDTASRLEDVERLLPPDRRLQVLLTLALINGIVVSPLSMVWLCYNPTPKQLPTEKIL
jgi:uncharacterized membrane protein YdjX (TVP38/TMEM64 family)